MFFQTLKSQYGMFYPPVKHSKTYIYFETQTIIQFNLNLHEKKIYFKIIDLKDNYKMALSILKGKFMELF